MGLFDRVKAMAQMDDRLVQELYKIFGELGWKQAGFKKAHRTMDKSEEAWDMHFNTPQGLIQVSVKDDKDTVGFINVTATSPHGGKKKKKKGKGSKMRIRVKDYVQRSGANISIVNREMLKNETKLFSVPSMSRAR